MSTTATAPAPFSFSTELRRLRTERGMRQHDLATKIGKLQPVISDWETGLHEPTLASRIKLARALDAPITALIPA